MSSPFATITHAVSAAVTGQTVIVGPGTYDEMVLITKQLTLISQTSLPSTTIVNATGEWVGIAVVGAAAAGTVIQGFTVTGANDEGIFVQNSAYVMIENNVVSRNVLDPQPGLGEAKGIQLTGTSNSTVAGNTVVGNMYGGVGITDSGPVDPSWNATAAPTSGIPAGIAGPANGNLISGNLIVDNQPNHCAIVISAYDHGEGVANNIVSGNTVVDNQNGVIVAADYPNTAAINNTVTSNNILNNGEGGVIVHSNAPGDIVTGNSIIDNVINGNGGLPDEEAQAALVGVIVGGEGPVPAQATTISGNTFANEGVGIHVVNGENTLVGGNTMEATVKLPINGTVTALPEAASQSSLASLSGTVSSLSGTVSSLSGTVDSANSQAQTATDLGYAAIAVAVVLGAAAIILSLRRPAPSMSK